MAKDMSVSWSSLETWIKCKQKDFLRTSGHKLKGTDIRTFFPGTVADRLMRAWLHDPIPGMLGDPDLVESCLDTEQINAVQNNDGVVKWKGPNDRAEVKAKLVRGLQLLEPTLTEHVVPYFYHPEYRFQHPVLIPGPDGDVRVQLTGGMDIFATDALELKDRTWYDVYDLKFTENKNYAASKKGQLTFYDLTTQLKFGMTCRKVAIFQPLIEDKPVHEFTINEEDRNYLLHQIVEMANSRWRGDVEPTSDPNACYKCDVAHACPKFINPRGGK